jgi:CheY-like chemotaxis protein
VLWHDICVSMVVKNVLIVDDERPFLLSLTDGLATYANDFTVVTALNGKEAVKVLDSTEVDLVVTDLRMPKMDGFELLAHMSGQYPNIPVIVMTAYGTPEIEERLQDMGTFQYLEKPLEFNVLADRIFDALKTGSSPDRIHGISLAAFLQLLEMENKTCTLMVKSQGKEGHLYFVKGELVQAETGKVKGEEAALDIVGWDNVAIEIQYTCTVKKKSIELPLAEILMEGFRIKDEKESLEASKGMEEASIREKSPSMDVTKEDHIDGEKKEVVKVDIKKLNKAMEALKEDLGAGLVYADIFSTGDGQAIVAYNPQPVADALFTRITATMLDTLNTLSEKGLGPKMGRYYQIELEDEKVATVIPLGDYIWGILVDTNKVQVGLLNNVVIPKAIRLFEEAHKG